MALNGGIWFFSSLFPLVEDKNALRKLSFQCSSIVFYFFHPLPKWQTTAHTQVTVFWTLGFSLMEIRTQQQFRWSSLSVCIIITTSDLYACWRHNSALSFLWVWLYLSKFQKVCPFALSLKKYWAATRCLYKFLNTFLTARSFCKERPFKMIN